MAWRLNGRLRLLFLSAAAFGRASSKPQEDSMKHPILPLRLDSIHALDERLKAWLHWLSPAPLADELIGLIEQLETTHLPSTDRTPASAEA